MNNPHLLLDAPKKFGDFCTFVFCVFFLISETLEVPLCPCFEYHKNPNHSNGMREKLTP